MDARHAELPFHRSAQAGDRGGEIHAAHSVEVSSALAAHDALTEWLAAPDAQPVAALAAQHAGAQAQRAGFRSADLIRAVGQSMDAATREARRNHYCRRLRAALADRAAQPDGSRAAARGIPGSGHLAAWNAPFDHELAA